MLSSDRRSLLLSLSAVALAGCGFTPVYAPGGAGEKLRGRIELTPPETRIEFDFNARMEERLGRAEAAAYLLDYQLTTTSDELAITPDQAIQRYNLLGVLAYQLRDRGSGVVLASGKVQNFTSYSAVGTTVATRAAERDAQARLAVILADLLVTRLIASSGDWPR